MDLAPSWIQAITCSHRFSSVTCWITIFYSSCCMPPTVLASVDLSNIYSMQPFITATQSILIDFPTFISHVLGVIGEAKFSYGTCSFLSTPYISRHTVPQSSIPSRVISLSCIPHPPRLRYNVHRNIMHVKLRGFPILHPPAAVVPRILSGGKTFSGSSHVITSFEACKSFRLTGSDPEARASFATWPHPPLALYILTG